MNIEWVDSGWLAGLAAVGTLLLAVFGIFLRWVRRPRLKVTFENRPRWVRAALIGPDRWGLFYRLQVTNTGRRVAKGVRARLDEWIRESGEANPNLDPFMLCWVSTKDPVISGIDLLANQEEFIDVFWVAAKNQGGRVTDEPDPMVHLCPQDPIAESQTGHRSGEASSVVRALVTRSFGALRSTRATLECGAGTSSSLSTQNPLLSFGPV